MDNYYRLLIKLSMYNITTNEQRLHDVLHHLSTLLYMGTAHRCIN